MNKDFYIYIMTNKFNTTFYIGVTNNLLKRVYFHRNSLIDGFTKKYKLTKLIYFEIFKNIKEAVVREKQLKNWHRDWKVNLIKSKNPNFHDLYNKIV
ncbi:GIY-YIG nuclease family protein [Candidatus Roizmanbacteria bacterium]|nr:GIY-YIG nuclease family protein [Candidatus Roizmanbacteria bacterium]